MQAQIIAEYNPKFRKEFLKCGFIQPDNIEEVTMSLNMLYIC